MTLLSRIFGPFFFGQGAENDREPLRPLWNKVVELARAPEWYAHCGVADSMTGRFDMLTLIMATVMLRMERDPALVEPSVRLSELFVEDMDGQMRQSGVGDLVVGKRMGQLMGALGGRLGALREALAQDDAALTEAARRNVTLGEGGDAGKVAARLRSLADQLDGLTAADLLAGKIVL